MTEALALMEEFKINSFSFLGSFCDWLVESPVPFIFITLFLFWFVCRIVKRLM